MDTTAFALRLIEAYKIEHNRYLRARAKKLKIFCDSSWTSQMHKLKLSYHRFAHLTKNQRTSELKRTRDYFCNNDIEEKFNVRYFVSQGIKNAHIRKANRRLAILRALSEDSLELIGEKKEELQKLKNTPVEAVLGKKWRELIDACIEENKAYETRWQVRCAISAFNKMNMGIQIKFGTCRRGGGSMSYINRIVVGDDTMKLAKFLDNALFETAILNG